MVEISRNKTRFVKNTLIRRVEEIRLEDEICDVLVSALIAPHKLRMDKTIVDDSIADYFVYSSTIERTRCIRGSEERTPW